MGNKMLIDATHPEETRVVVLRGNRVEEFDYESASKKQLRGNIYLAKVTRVEPSLQAAFVNYGGNRHGFLAFNEIHPDYYQLPLAERQALKQEEEQESFAASADSEDRAEASAKERQGGGEAKSHDDLAEDDDGNGAAAEAEGMKAAAEASGHPDDDAHADDEIDPQLQAAALEAALPATRYSAVIVEDNAPHDEAETAGHSEADDASDDRKAEAADDDEDDDDDVGEAGGVADARFNSRHANGRGDHGDHVESVGSEDALEELPQRHRRRRRSYKIQEVIRRGQIMLVQVVKEERGNKGAALTSYLSLAGRYTVLMPNTGSGGGISRKISSPSDRKRLREIAAELDVAKGMGLIIRTAGAARTKTEIKRDYEYLLRLWENVRDLTLKSSAPCLVYEEGDLIKRSIRDLYNREIDEVLVAGDDAYRDAKDFMRMLMPSHAKNVQPYKDPEPIFTRHEVERQLNAMFSPQVTLPSGGYIIINQTEALVAIDVNSGKATREYSIEDTALKTNLEAAEEIARQLRLRDLAGLIVADFIDMEEKRNNRAVERRLKECLRNDRARIQVGRISPFGLLEMSRQRLRTGMVEGSTSPCQHCQGTGFVRSTESVALSVLRSLEDWLRANDPCDLNAVASTEVSLYILNQKRSYLRDIESRHGVTVSVAASDRMHGANFYIEKVAAATPSAGAAPAAVTQSDRIIQPFESDGGEAAGDDRGGRSRRRRRRRRGHNDGPDNRENVVRASYDDADEGFVDDETAEEEAPVEVRAGPEGAEDSSGQRRRSRRRGRRGGRQQRVREGEVSAQGGEQDAGDEPRGGSEKARGREDRQRRRPERRETAAESEPETAKSVGLEAEQAPVKSEEAPRPDTSTFRSESEPSEGYGPNGVGKPNGRGYTEPAAESGGERLEPDQEADRELAEAAAKDAGSPPPSPKPRGTKRGWWQRR